jgi:outer membrane immunogenic protein
MKRFLLFLGGNLLLASLTQAQVGVRVGANLLNFNTSASDGARPSTSSRLGYQAGIYYQQPLTKRFSLVPEVQFSSEQAQVNADNYRNAQNYSLSNYRLHLSYLNVPVLLRFALGRVYFEAGPQASLLVGGRGSGQGSYLVGGDVGGNYAIDQSATDRFRRLQYGACVGIGVSLPAGLGLSVRAYQGFTSMNQATYSQDRAAIPYWDGDMHRQTLQASLTYQLASRYKLAIIKI